MWNARFDGWPHVIKSQQFSRQWLENFFFPLSREARDIFKAGGNRSLTGKRMVTLFWQPSTRTRGTFQMAMSYLGGEIPFATENAEEFSSAKKGESLRHTILVWNHYKPDVIVMRHKKEGAAQLAAEISSVPIINAGDGPGQHPTQALLDVFTIQEKLGHIDGISIALVGDLKKGRTPRSLAYLLSKFEGVKIFLISPDISRMKDDVKEHLREKQVWFSEGNDIRKVAPIVDAVYVIRDQKEYSDGSHRPVSGDDFLVIDKTVMALLPSHAIVMHPLPIDSEVEEIKPEVESDPRLICLTDQLDAGIFTKIALLRIMLF